MVNKTITKKLIKHFTERYSNQNKNKYKFGLINYPNNNSDFFRNILKDEENIKMLRIEDEDRINDSDFLALIINKEDFKRADFLLINK